MALEDTPIDATEITTWARAGRMFARGDFGGAVELIATDDAAPARPFPLRARKFLTRQGFDEAVQRAGADALQHASIHRLRDAAPDASAFRLTTFRQKLVCFALAVAAAFFAWHDWRALLVGVNALLTFYFLFAIGLRAALMTTALTMRPKPAPPALPDDALPTVTVLMPVFKEARGLAALADAIGGIDYPRDKLDLKLILEADDADTIAAARALPKSAGFSLVIVPSSTPKTKPKACNHALYLARGDLVVIYDAEDAPDPDQLRKAAAAFRVADEGLACVQARLNYYNRDENWLTRLFTLEYSLWFDSLLPAMERLRLPLPLGGTSNFFRTQTLIDVGGWDPYNVTEDADLGLRLARRGFRTEMIDSTTMEEANCRLDNWLRQRTRWMKGYVQTAFVHWRDPAQLIRVCGWRGLVSSQIFVAGTVVSALVNPLLWLAFFYWAATRDAEVARFFPSPLLEFNIFALLAGNAFFVYLAMAAPLRRGWPELSVAALLAPGYWLLASVAAYRALFQLIRRPFFWEKTEHGISAFARSGRP